MFLEQMLLFDENYDYFYNRFAMGEKNKPKQQQQNKNIIGM